MSHTEFIQRPEGGRAPVADAVVKLAFDGDLSPDRFSNATRPFISQALSYNDAMPTVLRLNGRRVVIYPNDHRPAHVHVVGPDAEAVYMLNCPVGPLCLGESYGFRLADVNRIATELAAALRG